MTHCQNCGSHVTERYARVLGDNNDDVHACPSCPDDKHTQARRMNGAAAGLDARDRAVSPGGLHQ